MISKVEEEISSFVVNLIKTEAGLKKVDFNLLFDIAEDIRKILLYIDLYNMEKSKNCNYVFGIVNDYLEHGIEEVSNEVLDTALKMDRAYYQDYIKSDKVISGIKALSFNDVDMYHALAVLDLDCVFNDSDFK